MNKNFSFTLFMEIDPPGDVYDSRDRDRDLEGLMDGRRHLDNARKGEELGYDVIGVGDHLYTNPDALVSCMAMAGVTSSVRVTQTVLINDFRHPVQVAKTIASIDVFSNGRAEVGLGTGYNQDEFRQSGVPFDPPKVRIARLREAAIIIKELLTSEEPVNFKGQYYQVDGLMGLPRPVQKPGPPLLIGAGGRLMLKLAAEIADAVDIVPGNFYPSGLPQDPRRFTMAALTEAVDCFKEAAGSRFDDLRTGFPLFKVVITEDREKAASQMQAEFDGAYRMLHGHEDGFPLSIEEILESPFLCIGTHDEIADKLREIRANVGCSMISVQFGLVEDFAPIVKALKGT